MYIYIYTIQHAGSVQLGCDAILDTISYFFWLPYSQFFWSTCLFHFYFMQVQKPCST